MKTWEFFQLKFVEAVLIGFVALSTSSRAQASDPTVYYPEPFTLANCTLEHAMSMYSSDSNIGIRLDPNFSAIKSIKFPIFKLSGSLPFEFSNHITIGGSDTGVPITLTALGISDSVVLSSGELPDFGSGDAPYWLTYTFPTEVQLSGFGHYYVVWSDPSTGYQSLKSDQVAFCGSSQSGSIFLTSPANDLVLATDFPGNHPTYYGLFHFQTTDASLPNGTTGTPYSYQLNATGGTPPFSWRLAPWSAPLPSGISLSTGGLLSGTLAERGAFPVTFEVTDSEGASLQKGLKLSVALAGDPTIYYPEQFTLANCTLAHATSMYSVDGNYSIQIDPTVSSIKSVKFPLYVVPGWGAFEFSNQLSIVGSNDGQNLSAPLALSEVVTLSSAQIPIFQDPAVEPYWAVYTFPAQVSLNGYGSYYFVFGDPSSERFPALGVAFGGSGIVGPLFYTTADLTQLVMTPASAGNHLAYYGLFDQSGPPPSLLIMAVDANRDGQILYDGSDDTSSDKPFRFWLNDDLDAADTDQEPIPNSGDYLHDTITNTRDLEDFTRIHILAPLGSLLDPTQWKCTLQFTDVQAGNPSINLWGALKPGLDYLVNEADAQAMVGQKRVAVVTTGSEQEIPMQLFSQGLQASLLFDGRTMGKAALRARFYRSGEIYSEGKIFLDFKPIQEMYEHYTVGDTVTINLAELPSVPSRASSFMYSPESSEDPAYILFVHGWRLLPAERRAAAETAYKRLWHQGYKGRFGLFSWPTEWLYADSALVNYTLNIPLWKPVFDRSERKAWLSAQGLRVLLQYLNQQYPGNVRIFAHSLGNVVVSEALKQAVLFGLDPLVHTYVATQAAISAQAYDPTVPSTFRTAVPNYYLQYPPENLPYFNNLTASQSRFVNFFNPFDSVLDFWRTDQKNKPDGALNYQFAQNLKINGVKMQDVVYYQAGKISDKIPLSIQNGNTYEIFAMCDPASCLPLGAQAGVKGPFRVGEEVNLSTRFSFGSGDHGAQFNADFPRTRLYWNQLLRAFKFVGDDSDVPN